MPEDGTPTHGATIIMRCLVCAGEAKDLTPPNFDGHVIDCPSCGKYEIAGCTWGKFQSASQPERAAALGNATSLQGFCRWPTIKTINF
jgi:predicted RNA-binding Zn-ribbon protein involved in translation (DUF1610 family)